MKLVIQIPAWNEEEALPRTLAGLPRSLPAFREVVILVVDDGSTDRTAALAEAAGARLASSAGARRPRRRLPRGAHAALGLGADVIVNLDADGQYDPGDLPPLVAPILAGRADVVIGDRGPGSCPLLPLQRLLQRLKLGRTAGRGHRGSATPARSRSRACPWLRARRWSATSCGNLRRVETIDFTLETIIQARRLRGSRSARASVPVATSTHSRSRRRSRLFSSVAHYVLVERKSSGSRRSTSRRPVLTSHPARLRRLVLSRARDSLPTFWIAGAASDPGDPGVHSLKLFSAAAGLFLLVGDGPRRRASSHYFFFTERAAGHVQIADPRGGADPRWAC